MLTWSYFGNPYVFGFTTLGLAGLSTAIALGGLSVVLSRTTPGPGKVSIVLCVSVTAVALVVALQLLQTFNRA